MGLAAIIGEADGIVSVALDPKYKLNAVHTYNLIVLESYIGKVRDPAAGSDLIEEMTEAICISSCTPLLEGLVWERRWYFISLLSALFRLASRMCPALIFATSDKKSF